MPDPIYTGRQLQALAYPCEQIEQVKLHGALHRIIVEDGHEYSTILCICPLRHGEALNWHSSVSCVVNGTVARITECSAAHVRGMASLAERLLTLKEKAAIVGEGQTMKLLSSVALVLLRRVSADEIGRFDPDWRERPMPRTKLEVRDA